MEGLAVQHTLRGSEGQGLTCETSPRLGRMHRDSLSSSSAQAVRQPEAYCGVRLARRRRLTRAAASVCR